MKTGIVKIFPRPHGFTLLELLVATAVLTLLILLVAQLISSAAALTTLGEKRIDADSHANSVLDRMAIDFSRMVKRPDLDYYLKSKAQPRTGDNGRAGNDQIAFYSEVPGYYPSNISPSPLSIVSYRLNATKVQLERMGKSLAWNGVASGGSPMVYLPITIKDTWPVATNQKHDSDYEVLGPEVFRFEYGYLLKGRKLADGSTLPSVTSDTPWDTRPEVAHTSVDGLRDVAAIIVYIAVIDPKSRELVNDLLAALAENLTDLAGGQKPGELESAWQNTIESCALPLPAKSCMRIYRRVYPL